MTEFERGIEKGVKGTHELEVRPLVKRVAELEAALRKTHDLVNDAHMNGFDPGMGDWLQPLQKNQEAISAILRKAT